MRSALQASQRSYGTKESCVIGGPFMINLNFAVEFRSPFSSQVFCVAPRIVRVGLAMAVRHAADGIVASPSAAWHVVSSSVVAAVWPGHLEPSMRAPLDDACTTGGVSCFTSGIDPGWANDILPLLLTGTCEDIEHLRVMEIVNYKDYEQPTVLFDTMGFGKPDAKAFADVKPGDTVRFEFRKGGAMDYELVSVRRVGGAK